MQIPARMLITAHNAAEGSGTVMSRQQRLLLSSDKLCGEYELSPIVECAGVTICVAAAPEVEIKELNGTQIRNVWIATQVDDIPAPRTIKRTRPTASCAQMPTRFESLTFGPTSSAANAIWPFPLRTKASNSLTKAAKTRVRAGGRVATAGNQSKTVAAHVTPNAK